MEFVSVLQPDNFAAATVLRFLRVLKDGSAAPVVAPTSQREGGFDSHCRCGCESELVFAMQHM
jgi:hypothetical protein